MKKVILGAAALLMTFAVSAQEKQQNDARRVPIETGVQPYQANSMVNGENEVFINQSAYGSNGNVLNNRNQGNEATVSQRGTGNFSSSYQGGKDNELYVTQGNEAVESTNNTALVEMRGKPAQGAADDQSASNFVEIRQFDSEAGAKDGGNVITVDVAGGQFGILGRNEVDVRQKGTNNNRYESGLDGNIDIDGIETNVTETEILEMDIDGPQFDDNNENFRNTLGFSDHIDVRGNKNKAYLTQEGDNNQANIKTAGDGASSTILQGGSSNTAWSYQAGANTFDGDNFSRGKENVSTIQQGAEFDPDGKAYDERLYDGPNDGVDNYAGAVQYGDYNNSEILQVDYSNQAIVKQVGTSNVSGVSQSGADMGEVGNTATVDQTGSKNWVDASQVGTANTATVTQVEGEAVAYTEATEDEEGNVYSNQSTSSQTGNMNAITVVQNDDDTSEITQNGQKNVADVEQTGTNMSTINQIEGALGNSAEVTQYNGSNTSTITQKDGGLGDGEGNEAIVDQDGTNTSDIDQTGGAGSYAYVEQTGSNTSDINQVDGDYNSAWVYQQGSGNSSTINQGDHAEGNTAWVWQKDMGQMSTIKQFRGDNNFAEVEQMDTLFEGVGGNENMMTQEDGSGNNAFLIQDGELNSNTLYQTGNYNTFNAQQTGSGNYINVTQNGLATYPEN